MLNDVEILIPSFCIELNTTQKEFCLLEFMCHGVVIGGINSTYVYKQPTTIEVALQNAGTTCDGICLLSTINVYLFRVIFRFMDIR